MFIKTLLESFQVLTKYRPEPRPVHTAMPASDSSFFKVAHMKGLSILLYQQSYGDTCTSLEQTPQ